jgi:hypothetical protein
MTIKIDGVGFERLGHHHVKRRTNVPIGVVELLIECGPMRCFEGYRRAFAEVPHDVRFDFEIIFLAALVEFAPRRRCSAFRNKGTTSYPSDIQPPGRSKHPGGTNTCPVAAKRRAARGRAKRRSMFFYSFTSGHHSAAFSRLRISLAASTSAR